MQLYLDSFGAYLSVRNGGFRVRTGAAEQETHWFAVRQVKAILLTQGTALSSDAALLAAQHDIPVLLIDAQTHRPLGQFSSGQPGSIATVRRRQLAFGTAPEGMAWVAEVLAAKVSAQMALLAHCTTAYGLSQKDLAVTLRVMDNLYQRFAQWQPPGASTWGAHLRDKAAETFRGQEGTASRVYFDFLGQIVTRWVPEYAGRGKRPAYDPFNAVLNYLYGMLYTQVHLALLKAGVDPFIGVLHADQYGGAPVMVFDCIEPYRPWADRLALELLPKLVEQADSFTENEAQNGLWLASGAKGTVIEAMLAWLSGRSPYEGQQVLCSVQIDHEARKLAARLLALEV